MADHNEAMRLAEWLQQNSSGVYRPAAEAADLLTRQAERIAELERLSTGLSTIYNEAMESLRIAVDERDTLRAEVERLRVDAERLDWLQQAMSEGDEKVPDICTDTGEFYFNYTQNGQTYCDGCSFELRRTIDCARTTHKETE